MLQAKKSVRELKRLKDFGGARKGMVRLDKNERTTPFEEAHFREMLASVTAEDLSIYPDQLPFYGKLARYLGLPVDSLLLTSGSDAAIKLIYETYVEPGDEVLYLDPTYAMIDVYADLFQARKIKIGYDANLELMFDELLGRLSSSVRVVFIANPNQPTGTFLDLNKIRRILEVAVRHNTLVVIDEAYIQFAQGPSSISLLKEFSNLAVTQTFSKAFGLASVRLGFIAAAPEQVDQLYKSKTLCDINLLALKAGEYLVDHPGILQDYVASVTQAKALLADRLEDLDIRTIASDANFIHFRMTERDDPKIISEQMKNRGYLIRVAGAGLPAVLDGCIRITVGPVDQMQKFLKEFVEVVAEVRGRK